VYDAVILAGGAARRLGGADKPALDVGGSSLLARAVEAVACAARIVIAGPRREVDTAAAGRLSWCREDPPGGGPVAALAAAVPHTAAGTLVVLAADLPSIGGAVVPLLDAVPTGGVALLTDADGRANFLAAAWQRAALVAALARVEEAGGVQDASMRALLRGVPSVLVPDADGWGADCDTWADVEAARRSARLGR
jgi:molybdopterin-guanine dinucleotide biosynthesis protein A